MIEPMTLPERLENPQRREPKNTDLLILDTVRSEADMREAALALRGESVVRRALVNEIKRLSEALADANEICRSTYQIAERNGAEVNWTPFKERLRRSLNLQHSIMYPKTQDVEPCV